MPAEGAGAGVGLPWGGGPGWWDGWDWLGGAGGRLGTAGLKGACAWGQSDLRWGPSKWSWVHRSAELLEPGSRAQLSEAALPGALGKGAGSTGRCCGLQHAWMSDAGAMELGCSGMCRPWEWFDADQEWDCRTRLQLCPRHVGRAW